MDWIKWADKPPPEDTWMIFGSSVYSRVDFGVVIDGKPVNPDLNYDYIIGITHWMEMPKPPEEL